MTEQPAHDRVTSDAAPAIDPLDGETRALTVVLSDAEWRALRRLESNPVDWLRAQVRDRLRQAGPDARRPVD
jgi:hypothetical protein